MKSMMNEEEPKEKEGFILSFMKKQIQERKEKMEEGWVIGLKLWNQQIFIEINFLRCFSNAFVGKFFDCWKGEQILKICKNKISFWKNKAYLWKCKNYWRKYNLAIFIQDLKQKKPAISKASYILILKIFNFDKF